MKNPAEVRQGVLARMERSSKLSRLGIMAAAMVEALLLAFAVVYLDWNDKLQVELFVFSIMGYTVVVLGLAALAAHMNRLVERVLQALYENRQSS